MVCNYNCCEIYVLDQLLSGGRWRSWRQKFPANSTLFLLMCRIVDLNFIINRQNLLEIAREIKIGNLLLEAILGIIFLDITESP